MYAKKKTSIIDLEDLRSFWKIFSRNWYIILVFLLLSFIACYFYTYKLPNIYAAKSQVLLKTDETYDYQSQLFKGLGYYEAFQDNTNQIRILSSSDIIKKTLSKLRINTSYYIVGRLKTTEVYESMPFDFSMQVIYYGLYEQQIKFKILDENTYQITYLKNNAEIIKKFRFNEEIVDSDFILSVNKNDNINNNTILSLKEIEYLVQVHNLDNLINKFRYALTIENIESTTILELTLEDEIPYRAVAFLDTLAKVYIDYTAQSQFTINENTLINIDKQLAGVVKILDSLESDLENYKSDKSILDLNRQEDQYFDELLKYDAQKRATTLWIESLESLEKYILAIDASKDDKLLPPSFYIGDHDDYLKTAINELYSLQMARNRTMYGATKENKSIENLDLTMELLKKNILIYISNSKKGLTQRISDFENQIRDYTSIIKTVPKTQRGLLNIQRKVDVNQKMYMFLLEKRANTIIAKAGILPQTSIIETAHSVGIVKPNKTKILYLFLLLGTIVAFLVIFIRLSFFSTIDSIDELKRHTNLPILAEIMLSSDPKANEYMVVNEDPKAAITEKFRTIRTNLEYMSTDVGPKVVLVTSYNPGEGKTFCSVNLATILAKADKKVLLVELDLHRPKIQKALKMSSDIGMSTILIGKTDIAETIIPTGIDNLSVILSGPTPPNASELILSKYLKQLFDYGRANFDYMIIDTAPVGLITDALVIMKNVDTTLFVLNAKYAKKQILSAVNEIVVSNKIKNLGLILNGVKRNRLQHYYYRYGYNYGYGYNSNSKTIKKKESQNDA